MAYTDLIITGDRLIVSELVEADQGLMPGTRDIRTYRVQGNCAVRISDGRVARINRRNNGAVYIGRNAVIARA